VELWLSWRVRKVTVVLLCLLALGACNSSPPVTQPVQFNHLAHTKRGLQCNFCHQYAQKADFAGLPRLTVCATCHRAKISSSEEAEKVRVYVKDRKEIPWHRIYRMPSHVNFSHQRHVTVGKLECKQCHGDIKNSAVPQVRPAVALTMSKCIACHDQRKVSTDCLACHH